MAFQVIDSGDLLLLEHYVRHQALVARHIFTGHHHRLAHSRMLAEHCFDLA